MKYILCIVLLAALLYSGCGGEKTDKPEMKPPFVLKKAEKIPSFDSKYAFAMVEKQVALGPRVPNSDAHRKAKELFASVLVSFADTVIRQDFNYTGYNGEQLSLTNIIGRFNPSSNDRILLCAHWDSRPRADMDKDSAKRELPILGANDGASGVGVLLALAKLMKEKPPAIGVDLVLLDGEDYGKESDLTFFCLGSKYFAIKNPAAGKYRFGILLDLVGDTAAVFRKEAGSVSYAPDVVELVWGIAKEIGASHFQQSTGGGVYDDHVPLNEGGIRTIDIIDADLVGAHDPDPRRKYWHTQSDDMKNISAETLNSIGTVLANIIYRIEFSENTAAH